MPESSRDRIIQVAHDLFYRVGFQAVGLDAILAEVGVTKTTFYNHFQTKDDLVLATLDWHDSWWQDTFRQLLKKHGGDTPRGQLLAIPAAIDEVFENGGYNGCFFINVAVQFPLAHDPAHQAAAAHKRSMEAIIRELAGYAGLTDPAGFAEECSLLMEGAYVTRQVTGNPNAAAIARRLLEGLLGRYSPAKSKAREQSAKA